MMQRRGTVFLALGVACTVFFGGIPMGWAASVKTSPLELKYDARLSKEKFTEISLKVDLACQSFYAMLAYVREPERVKTIKQHILCAIEAARDSRDTSNSSRDASNDRLKFNDALSGLVLHPQIIYNYILGLYVRIPRNSQEVNLCRTNGRSQECIDYIVKSLLLDNNMAVYEPLMGTTAERKRIVRYVQCYAQGIGATIKAKKENQSDFDRVSAQCRIKERFFVSDPSKTSPKTLKNLPRKGSPIRK